jgi:quercetin dioxygenase-like cupin family protein
VKDLAFNLMTMVRGEELGGVLITRIPPGGECKPHIDSTWHAKYYDKYAIQIEAHPNQAFCFEDGGYASAPGEIYWFENNVVHWVKNDSPVDRITLIISIKSDRRIQSCHSQ